MPSQWGKVTNGLLRTPGPAGGGSRGSRGAVVQWRGGVARSALPVVQGTVEIVAGLWWSGVGLGGRVTERRRLREVLGLTCIWVVAFQVGILGVRLRTGGVKAILKMTQRQTEQRWKE